MTMEVKRKPSRKHQRLYIERYRFFCVQGSFQPAQALGDVPVHDPERSKRARQRSAVAAIVVLQDPGKGKTDVGVVDFELLEPRALLERIEHRLSCHHQVEKVRRMTNPNCRFLTACGELFQGKLTDRLQHREARTCRIGCGLS